MAEKENIVMLTSLVDGEIDDENVKSELEKLITSDIDARFDYAVQDLMKKLVKEKIGFVKAPEKLYKKVRRRLLREVVSPTGTMFPAVFSRPYISFATVAVVILAIVLIVFNRPPLSDVYNFALEQNGNNNMYVQAQNNFQAIVAGQLKPQLLSNNAEEIKNYFEKNGVTYSTIVPVFDNLNLVGAVISDEGGEKFAHHVYSTTEGKLVYLYQVDEETIIEGNKITLSKDFIKFLDEGSCYSYSQNRASILLVKARGNICAIVSDLPQNELKESFCNLN